MKTKLLLFLFIGFSLFAKAEDSSTSLVVWAKDGSKVAYALSEKPKVTFTASDLVITANGVEVNYALANMDRITYEDVSETSVTDLLSGKSFRLDGESLLFPALRSGSTVSVYTLNGSLVFRKTVSQDGEYAFPLSGLNAGVYMVHVNGLTYKIQKR